MPSRNVSDGNRSVTFNQTLLQNISLTDYNNENEISPWRNGLFGIGGACIACVGVVCNCISIIVLAHYRKLHTRSSAPILLISLEVFDTIFLVFELFLENLVFVANSGVISFAYLDFIKPVYCVTYPVPHVAWTCATFLVVVITLERYIVVAWPLSAHRICRPTYAKVAVAVVTVGAVLYQVPLYMAFTCSKYLDNDTQTEMLEFSRTEFGSSHYFARAHMTWVKLCVNFVVPFLVLLTFNALLLTVLWRSKMSLYDDSQRQARKEKILTVMVVFMTATFFVCELMSAVAFIMVSGLNTFSQCSLICNRFTAVADTLVIVNAASNFAIYCASGRKFREIFSRIFFKRCRPSWAVRRNTSTKSSNTVKTQLTNFLWKNHSHTEGSFVSRN